MDSVLLYISFAVVIVVILYILFTFVFKKQGLGGINAYNIRSFITMNNLLLGGGITALILIAIVFYNYYTSSKPKYSANNESSQGTGTNNTATLMLFFADWCPHCKAAKPIWEELKDEYSSKLVNGYQIVFTEVDCSEETTEVEQLMNQYKIEGYPTIKMVKDGQVIEYDAKPTKENLHKFLNTVL
jgi:thiol-disulfide isomerase/thioredoxin